MYRIIFVNHGNVIVKTGLIMLILVDHFYFLYVQDNDIEYDNAIRNFNDLSLELQF